MVAEVPEALAGPSLAGPILQGPRGCPPLLDRVSGQAVRAPRHHPWEEAETQRGEGRASGRTACWGRASPGGLETSISWAAGLGPFPPTWPALCSSHQLTLPFLVKGMEDRRCSSNGEMGIRKRVLLSSRMAGKRQGQRHATPGVYGRARLGGCPRAC